MPKDSHHDRAIASIALLGPPANGKTWLAQRLIACWRQQPHSLPRLILDTGRGHELAARMFPGVKATASAATALPSPIIWPAITEREAFENWLAEMVEAPLEGEEWLIWPRSVAPPEPLIPNLVGYALPRLMKQGGGCCLLDDPAPWLLAVLPPEDLVPVWVVSAQSAIGGWEPQALPWSGHPPCLLVTTLCQEDETPQALQLLSRRIAELQASERRLSYVGRIPWGIDTQPEADSRWLVDLMARLPFNRPIV